VKVGSVNYFNLRKNSWSQITTNYMCNQSVPSKAVAGAIGGKLT